MSSGLIQGQLVRRRGVASARREYRDLQLGPAGAQDLERNVMIVAPHHDVDARLAYREIAQREVVDEGRQPGIEEPHLLAARIDLQPQRSLDHRERRSTGPG